MTDTAVRAKQRKRLVSYSIIIAALAAALYALGAPGLVFLPTSAAIVALALGERFRSKPNVSVARVMYIALFAAWVGLAIFFGLSAAVAKAGLLEKVPFPLIFGLVTVPGVVLGGVIGDRIGKQRNYRAPDWVP